MDRQKYAALVSGVHLGRDPFLAGGDAWGPHPLLILSRPQRGHPLSSASCPKARSKPGIGAMEGARNPFSCSFPVFSVRIYGLSPGILMKAQGFRQFPSGWRVHPKSAARHASSLARLPILRAHTGYPSCPRTHQKPGACPKPVLTPDNHAKSAPEVRARRVLG